MATPADSRTLPRRRVAGYALAAFPSGFTFVLITIYLAKYCTDVLGLAPSVMAALLVASWLWDALLDPLAGVISDRTRSHWGRRRPWLVLGALPMSAGFAMLWSAPAALSPAALAIWSGGALFAFFTGLTLVDVTHSALGAELTTEYQQRTRIFGWRRALFGAGALLAVGAVGWIERAADPRAAGASVAVAGAALVLVLVPLTAFTVSERPDYQGKGGSRAARSFLDVLHNPHARTLLLVFGLQQIGVGMISAVLPYFSEYVLGTPQWTDIYLLGVFLTSLLAVPLWLRIAGAMEKRTAVRISMAVVLAVISVLGATPPGSVAFVLALAVLTGVASAGMDVLGPSLQADVIDWDELHTGERKEGAYFATWAFAQKSATALALLLVGVGLQATGFQANAVQTPLARLGLRALIGGVPTLFFGLGLLVFWRFRLTAAEHARIRREIEMRAPGQSAAMPSSGPITSGR